MFDNRQRAKQNFIKSGWPSTKIEDWKYTELKAYEHWGLVSKSTEEELKQSSSNDGVQADEVTRAKSWIQAHCLPRIAATDGLIVYINGRFCTELSQIPANLVSSIHTGKYFEWEVASSPGYPKNSLVDLNRALFSSQICVEVKAGLENAATPILYIVHYATNRIVNQHTTTQIHLEEKAKLEVVQIETGEEGAIYMANNLSQWRLESKSSGKLYRLQSESDQALSFNILDVDLEKESEFESISIGGGAKVSRSDVRVGLNGKGASAKVFGASKLGEGQHNDNLVWVDHAVEDCQSEQSFKSIVSRKSKNIMNGTIWVRPGANQTSASQKSQNLLLSSEGEVVIKPRLEIHADDVKCSHGATTGQINKDALFYLRSRGFSESEANMILARAFIYEVLDKIENESAKEVIENNLSEKLDATFRRQIVR